MKKEILKDWVCKLVGHKWRRLMNREILQLQSSWDKTPNWLESLSICMRCDIHSLKTKSIDIAELLKRRRIRNAKKL